MMFLPVCTLHLPWITYNYSWEQNSVAHTSPWHDFRPPEQDGHHSHSGPRPHTGLTILFLKNYWIISGATEQDAVREQHTGRARKRCGLSRLFINIFWPYRFLVFLFSFFFTKPLSSPITLHTLKANITIAETNLVLSCVNFFLCSGFWNQVEK